MSALLVYVYKSLLGTKFYLKQVKCLLRDVADMPIPVHIWLNMPWTSVTKVSHLPVSNVR